MDALPVVVNLDVFEDGGFEFGVGCPLFSMHEFFLERREETLGDGIVLTIAFAAHADGDALALQNGAVSFTRVLTPAIGLPSVGPPLHLRGCLTCSGGLGTWADLGPRVLGLAFAPQTSASRSSQSCRQLPFFGITFER